MRTTADWAAAICIVQTLACSEVAGHFQIEADGSFIIDTAIIEVRKRVVRYTDVSRSTFGGRQPKVLAMGSVHKFQRPPKNEQQFKGYRPTPPNGPRGGNSARWQLRNWQKSLIAWSALVLFAVGIWGIGRML